MPVSCGTDLISVSRIARAVEQHEGRFLARVFHESELLDCGWPDKLRMNSLAGRFAAKEAVVKALGTGIGKGVRWTDIRIVSEKPSRKPTVKLEGQAFDRLNALDRPSISISISHDGDLAMAFCVITSLD